MKSIVLKVITSLFLILPSFNTFGEEVSLRLNEQGCMLFSQLFGAVGNDKIIDKVPLAKQMQILEDMDLRPELKEFVKFVIHNVYKSKATTVEEYNVFGMMFLDQCMSNRGLVTFQKVETL